MKPRVKSAVPRNPRSPDKPDECLLGDILRISGLRVYRKASFNILRWYLRTVGQTLRAPKLRPVYKIDVAGVRPDTTLERADSIDGVVADADPSADSHVDSSLWDAH